MKKLGYIMHYSRRIVLGLLLTLLSTHNYAAVDNVQLSVWSNEAIIATYTYSYRNFIDRQKQIAMYFTADGWIAFSKAFQEAKLPDTIRQNSYTVSAVATLPPTIKPLDKGGWQATMPILVLYKNFQYQQKQTLNVVITFVPAPAGQGVRGFAITSLKAVAATMPCQCKNESSSKAIV
jgi:hypothetical protein